MNKSFNSAATGMAIGMLAGTAAYMMSRPASSHSARRLRKSAGRAMRNAGVIIESISEMMR